MDKEPETSTEDFFNQRNGIAQAQAVTETGTAAATNSNYVQQMFQIRHLQTFGNIGDYARKTTRQLIDLRESEIRSASMGLAFLQETLHIYGNAAATGGTPVTTATGTIYSGHDGGVAAGGATVTGVTAGYATARPQWDGLDTLVRTNIIDFASAVPTTMAPLDSAIDAVETAYAAGVQNDNYFFIMSPKMRSKFSSLLISQQRFEALVMDSRDNQASGPMGYTNVAAGLRLMTYRDIPILPSSFVSNLTTMGAISTAASSSGSALANSAYRYQVSVVSILGESTAAAESSVTPTAGQIVTVSWTFPTLTDPLGQAVVPLLFKIYRTVAGAATGLESLLDVIPAKTGVSGSETNVTAYVDNGALLPNGKTFPRVANAEDIWLVPRDRNIIVQPQVTTPSLVPLAKVAPTTEQFAIIADQALAVRAEPFIARITRIKYV